ncbi:hypothetical protein [Neptuniibacter halophilus]|uniref:hypothetical protein n=1 Tax=Neptuniibacter halophilus TaxID=651666 RepID=UPI0025748898|nr:hypothetical protein [Neptuniibacter halophilus]
MSLFQCPKCGCRENTATGYYWEAELDDKEPLCSACHTGEWHNKFPRVFYPKGILKTNEVGNLQHIQTGVGGRQLEQYESEEEQA